MAFGRSELRLILGVQAYGTTNLARLRRDISSLGRAAETANANQARVGEKAARNAQQLATKQRAYEKGFNTIRAQREAINSRVAQAEEANFRKGQAARGTILRQTNTQLGLEKKLQQIGYRGAVLQDVLAGKTSARSAQAQKLVRSWQAAEHTMRAAQHTLDTMPAAEQRLNAAASAQRDMLRLQLQALRGQKIELTEIEALQERILGIEMKQAAALDAQAAKAQRLQRREVMGRTIAHAGRTAQFAGLIGTAVFTASANAAADLGRKTALAGTQMRDVAGTFQQGAVRGRELQNVILHMMDKFPADAQAMSDSAYEIFSSMNLVHNGVVDVTEGYKLMAVANKVAVAGQVDLDEATSAMIVTLNNFDPALKDVGGTMDTVFSIVRFGQMRLSDFAAAMVPLAPVAKTAGLGLQDVGAALASLTILFKSPQQAAQGLARAIELFQLAPFEEGFHKLGIEVYDSAHKMRPLSEILEDISKQFPDVATGQRSIINLLTTVSKASGLTKAGIQGTVQARRALGGLLTSMNLYRNILQNIHGDQNEFNNAFNAMKDTPGVQWAIFINQMKAFALVIGQAALPVMLRIGDWLVKAAHWIEDLVKKTNGAVIKWAAFAAVGLLVGGTLVNIAGSAIALSANLRLATMAMVTMEGEAVKAGIAVRLLNASMLILAGIGIIAIPIVLQIIKKGDPGLWDFLGAAGAGAVGGAMIGGAVGGPPGALIGGAAGAIAVPITVDLISHFQKPDPKSIEPAKKAFSDYTNSFLKVNANQKKINAKFGIPETQDWIHNFDDFQKVWASQFNKIPRIGEDVAQAGKAERAKPKTAAQKYEDYVKAFTKAQLDAQNKYLDSLNVGDTAADRAASLAKKRATIVKDAYKQMQEEVKQAVDKLGQTYDQFLQMNQNAFGQVFQGPVLSGFMGDIFSSINSLLMQFGQTIPVPIQIIQNDLDVQMKNFGKLREGYAALVKKGVPPEVVKSIQEMGMAGLPFVQGLLQASGPQFSKWLATMKKSHGDIVKATEIDFHNQLQQWKKYGSDIATKMMEGLSSDAAQATIKGGFEKYVMDIFGDTLRKNMAKTISENVAAAVAEAKAEDAAKDATKKGAQAAIRRTKKARDKALGIGEDQVPKAPGKVPSVVVVSQDTIRKGAGLPALTASGLPPMPSATLRGQTHTIVNNHGDQVTIHADGVHPTRVSQAINKHGFQTRNKRRGR